MPVINSAGRILLSFSSIRCVLSHEFNCRSGPRFGLGIRNTHLPACDQNVHRRRAHGLQHPGSLDEREALKLDLVGKNVLGQFSGDFAGQGFFGRIGHRRVLSGFSIQFYVLPPNRAIPSLSSGDSQGRQTKLNETVHHKRDNQLASRSALFESSCRGDQTATAGRQVVRPSSQ